jgi:hypothetical protein
LLDREIDSEIKRLRAESKEPDYYEAAVNRVQFLLANRERQSRIAGASAS